MIFLLGVLWGEEPVNIPIADQKVIQYLVDKSSEETSDPSANLVSSPNDKSLPDSSVTNIPASLQEEIAQQTRPSLLPASQQSFPELGVPWWWGVLFAALVLGALRYFVRPDPKKIGTIKIQSRASFGQEGSVVAIEVQDAQQNPRIILLGLHSKGAPRFLADLSPPIPFPELEEALPIPSSVRIPRTSDIPKESTVMVQDEEAEDKEALVEQILRMRENKVNNRREEKNSTETSVDKWTEGFHEVLRK